MPEGFVARRKVRGRCPYASGTIRRKPRLVTPTALSTAGKRMENSLSREQLYAFDHMITSSLFPLHCSMCILLSAQYY